MTKSEKFINWLEGMLDASKNKLTHSQVKEIRKKIKEYHDDDEFNEDINYFNSAYPLDSSLLNSKVDEEYIKEIERNKHASTMDDLI